MYIYACRVYEVTTCAYLYSFCVQRLTAYIVNVVTCIVVITFIIYHVPISIVYTAHVYCINIKFTMFTYILIVTRYIEKKSIPITALWCPAFSNHG